MISIGVLTPGAWSNGWLLTCCRKERTQQKAFKRNGNVSLSDELLIFFIYEGQSLDLFSNFVRINAINRSRTERFGCVPIELFVVKQQRLRGRSVANWQ
jgi:hypothetical protein